VFVGSHMPPEGGSIECDWRPGQPRQVDLIHINRVHPVDRHNWRWLEFNAIQYDAIERLQNAITKKVRRVLLVSANVMNFGYSLLLIRFCLRETSIPTRRACQTFTFRPSVASIFWISSLGEPPL
jgi:hypothetical protein